MRNLKKIILGLVTVSILILAYLAISPLFRDVEIDDALPAFMGTKESVDQEIKEVVEESKEDVGMRVSPQPAEELGFPVVGTLGHPAEGVARVLVGETETVVRYENFMTINGPNLHVYLSTDLEATEYVDLGPIKGTSGNINYSVPEGISLTKYPYILTWCVPFKVLFNYAELR